MRNSEPLWQPLAAFSLLELLLVVTLLGSVMLLGIGAWKKAQHQDPLAETLAELQRFDARQRRLSRLHGPRSWRADPGGLTWAGDLVGSEPPDTAVWRPREGVYLDWLPASDAPTAASVETLTYTNGFGPDLRVELRDGQRRQRWLLLGLSGQWVAE